jgi:DNA-binding transcriptional LysR family regulator
MKLSGIDLNILVAVDALLSERNVTRAAVRIGRSQPATSHALNRARELFRDPLLVRIGGGLELTARARIVAPKIHRLLRELGAVLDVHKEFDPAAIECVTIGATDYVGFVLLPYVFAMLQEVAPQMSVRVRAVEGPDALGPLSSGILDLAVGAFPQIPAGLRTDDLFQEEFVCLRRRGRGATKMTVEAFAKLAHVLVVSPSSGMGSVDYALAKRGRSRHIAAYVPHFLVAPSIVAATDLVVTTGRRVAERVAPMLGLETFECPLPLKPFVVRTVWHPRTDGDSVGQWLRAVFREAATKMTHADMKPRDDRRATPAPALRRAGRRPAIARGQ